VPQWNCGCRLCRCARIGDPRVRARTQASLAVSVDGARRLLLNASTDVSRFWRGALHPRESVVPRRSPQCAAEADAAPPPLRWRPMRTHRSVAQCGMTPGNTCCCSATSTPRRRVSTTLCQKVRLNTTPSCPRRSVTETPVAIFCGEIVLPITPPYEFVAANEDTGLSWTALRCVAEG
jgi:hypothetical protein